MFKARIIYSCLNQEPQDRAYTLESTNFVIFNSKSLNANLSSVSKSLTHRRVVMVEFWSSVNIIHTTTHHNVDYVC